MVEPKIDSVENDVNILDQLSEKVVSIDDEDGIKIKEIYESPKKLTEEMRNCDSEKTPIKNTIRQEDNNPVTTKSMLT